MSTLLNSFGLQQHVDSPTHVAGRTIDLVISRSADNVISSCLVSDFISDHNAVIATISCGKPHAKRKTIQYRKLKSIDMSHLISDLNSSRLVTEDPDTVDDAVTLYNTVLQDLLDKHAPISSRSIAACEPQPWISEDILSAKRDRRSTEKMWRKSNLTVHKLIYKEKCEIVKELIQKSKSEYFLSKITQCDGDQKKLFGIVDSLLGRGKPKQLPTKLGPLELAHAFNDFFRLKNIYHPRKP